MKLNASEWRLPSGRPLGEYALKAGFVVPSLWAPVTRRQTQASTVSTSAINGESPEGGQERSAMSFAPYRRRVTRDAARSASSGEC